MSWCCCCLFPDVVPSLKAGGDPIPWAHPGLCWRCHGAGSGPAQPQTLGSSNHWGPSHFQPPAALVKRKNGNNGHGPMGGMMIVFSWKKKKKRNWGEREANAFIWLKFHSCAWTFVPWASSARMGRILLMCVVQTWHKRAGDRAIQPPIYFKTFLAVILCYRLGILLQNMDILNYNLPLLSYWSWLCLRFGRFPNTISVFTCSSQRGNYMWKHSIRRWYFVAIIHKPCVYMGFLRRIQSISPFCDASTSISNDCSKSLCFLQK